MRLSIVIPSYRRIDLLELCLRSVFQFKPTDSEVIVVDDGSRNGIVSQLADSFACRVIRHNESLGFANAANAGVQAAQGSIVELLNDDTEVTANWADHALVHFANPIAVAVAPLVLMHPATQSGPTRIDSAGDGWDPGGYAFKRGHGDRLDEFCLSSGLVWGVSASAGFYRRSTFLESGGYPADFGAYFEDVDLSHRLQKYGQTIFEPQSIVWHRVSASYGRFPSRKTLIQQSCNEERVYWRNQTSKQTWPRHLAVLAGKAFRRLCEGEFEPWLRGRFQALMPNFRAKYANDLSEKRIGQYRSST